MTTENTTSDKQAVMPYDAVLGVVLSDKQREVLSLMNRGYAMKKIDNQLYMLTNSDKKIPLDWDAEIKPFHDMGLIKNHSTVLDYVYLNLTDKGKMACK